MIEFFQEVSDWLTTGIYEFFIEAYAWVIIKVTLFKFQALASTVEIAWDVAREVLIQLNVSQELNAALSSLPPDILAQLNFFNVPLGINMLLNAIVTRFVLRFTMTGL